MYKLNTKKKQYKARIHKMLYNANINDKEHIFTQPNYTYQRSKYLL